MTFFRLLLRDLLYHWRGNLAVFLGVALGTAVLTGALLVGDSLRGSLRALTLDQLGWVEQALVPGRFFRAALASELPAEEISPTILLQGSATHGSGEEAARAPRVTVLGVDASFWPANAVPVAADFWRSQADEVVVNRSLADALGAKAGDALTLQLHKEETIPRETLLGRRKTKDVVEAVTVTVRAVLPDEGLARFTLKPTPEPALNAFLPLGFLQKQLDQPGRANALLAGAGAELNQESLQRRLTLDDWGLRLRSPEDRARSLLRYLDPREQRDRLPKARWRGRVPDELAKQAEANNNQLTAEQVLAYYQKQHPYWSLESRQMFLAPPVVDAVRQVAATTPVQFHTTLVYLADTLSDGTHEVPYAVVAGADGRTFQQEGDTVIPRDLKDDEIALVQWPGSPLSAKPGDKLFVTYYAPDTHNHLEKRQAAFTVARLVPMAKDADDPDLTPEFPGITDKLDMGSWENPPFPYSARRVKPEDEEYWRRYRATPRAYVNLATAQKLWGSRFGNVSSLQIYLPASVTPAEFERRLLDALAPEAGGFVIQPVRAQAERASAGSADFGLLFLGFSFFLIASALLLVGLLVRLNIDRRAGEIGLLLATGWSHGRVRWLLLGEGIILAVLGGGVGLLGALAYAPLVLEYFRVNWPGAASLDFLRLHAEPASFAIGYGASLLVSVLTIFWATRVLGQLSPRALLAGETTSSNPVIAAQGRPWSLWVMAGAGVGALALAGAGFFVEGHEAKAGTFFGSGALLLAALLAGVWRWLRATGRQSTPQPSLTRLGVRNAGRHAVRSVLTVGLLAAATFLIVAVESFHREAGADFAQRTGGSGGFPLVAESAVPIYQDLNRPAVREELGLADDPRLADVHVYSCRVRGGDDASCLNLYQPLKPRVVGLPASLLEQDRFRFRAGLWQTEAERENPWLLLEQPTEDGAIPAILDANTAQWILKTGLGETLDVENGQGEKVKLRVVALLQESIFQSEVLVSEANFLKLYPRHEGFGFFLIDGPPERAAAIKTALESKLGGQGLSVMPTAQRLQAYLAVENTYLATFQALGGLGLLLGAAGLAIVLLRGVWERRGELALLQALGFRTASLAWLVLAENAYLLLLGLAVGTGAALLAVAPHLAGTGADVLWLRLLVLLGLVVGVGLVAGLAAVLSTLRTPVLVALRRE